MNIDSSTVDKLADLAKLEFDKSAKEDIIHDLNKVLAFVDKLNELDTEDIEPLTYMSDETTITRKDEVKQVITQQEALSNAPQKDSDYILVPKVLGSKQKA